MSRIPTQLSDPTVAAVVIRGDQWPRGMMSETPIPDAWMGLVETSDGVRRYAPAGEDPRPGRDDMLLLVRNRAITVPLAVREAPTSDGHAVDGVCEILLRWPARDDDLGALRRHIGGARQVTLARLAEWARDAGAESALRAFLKTQPTETLLREDVREQAAEHIRGELKRFLFELGAQLERIGKLDLASESFQRARAMQRETQSRLERIKAREMVESAALNATNRRVGQLGDILDKLKQASAGDNDLRWRDLLPSLTPAERGKLLENLWRLTPDRRCVTAIVAVSGDECVWIDPAAPDKLAKRKPLPDELGGLRSVSHDPQRGWLLVGAANGVWAVCAETGSVLHKFAVPDAEPQRTGFNAAVIVDGRLYATHSKLGCWSWSVEQPSDAKSIFEPVGATRGVRAVTGTDDGRVLFAADDCVQVYEPSSESLSVLCAADDAVYSLAVHDSHVYVGDGEGRLLQADLRHPDAVVLVHRAPEPIESLCVRRWTDLAEIVVPAGRQGVSGIYAEERVTARLLDAPTSIRRAWASDDCVVGLNDRRDRLVIMNADAAERTAVESLVSRETGNSIQDACIVVERNTQTPESRGDLSS